MARPIRTLAAAAALGCAALLTACGAGTPGTAAVADGVRISETTAQAVAAQLTGLTGQPTDVSTVVEVLAYTPAIDRVAAEHGFSYPDEVIVDAMESQAAQAEYEIPEGGFAPETVDVVRTTTLAQQIYQSEPPAPQELDEALSAVDLEVNPRYGTAADGGIQPTMHEWIAPVQD